MVHCNSFNEGETHVLPQLLGLDKEFQRPLLSKSLTDSRHIYNGHNTLEPK